MAPRVRKQKTDERKTFERFTATISDGIGETPITGIFRTRDMALKAGIDAALRNGLIVVRPITVKRKVTTDYEVVG